MSRFVRLEAGELAGLVPFLQSGIDVEFRVLDDCVAEAADYQCDGVEPPRRS